MKVGTIVYLPKHDLTGVLRGFGETGNYHIETVAGLKIEEDGSNIMPIDDEIDIKINQLRELSDQRAMWKERNKQLMSAAKMPLKESQSIEVNEIGDISAVL